MSDPIPFAYVAHKDGKWMGAIVANMDNKEIKKFYSGCAGCQIVLTQTRAEYDALVKALT